MSFYSTARLLASPFLRFVFGIKREGLENIQGDAQVILCSNHRSNFDPVILGAALPYELKYMAKEELFRIPVFSGLIRMLGAFPVHRGKHDIEVIKTSLKLLKSGKVVAMFPEGHRLKEGGTPRHFQRGVALFAYKSHVPVLPVAIATKGGVRPFKRNIVRVGKPLTFEELGFTDGGTENLREVSETLHEKVTALLGETAAVHR